MVSFSISKEEMEQIEIWDDPITGHKCTAEIKTDRKGNKSKYSGAIGGGITYMFVPTSIGTITKVRCGFCGEELDLTDYLSW